MAADELSGAEPLPLNTADLVRAVHEERRRNADLLDTLAKAFDAVADELDAVHLDVLARVRRGQATALRMAATAIRTGAPSLGGRGP